MDLRMQYLLCGRPDDAFMSQLAMFRLGLKALGSPYSEASLAMSLDRHEPIPERWKPWVDGVKFAYAPHDHIDYLVNGKEMYANTRLHSYDLVDPFADVCVVCDMDTLQVRPFEEAFLRDMQASPFIGGVTAHFPPPLKDSSGHDWEHLSLPAFWNMMGRHAIGRDLPTRFVHSVSTPEVACPFYINYGFVATTPSLLTRASMEIHRVQTPVRELLDTVFYGQISLALAVEKLGLPARALPMRYNFPNDPLADAKRPDELREPVLLHYLRTEHFDRHRIFTTQADFNHFLSLRLDGSNAVFQRHVRELTGGRYPFA